ncbi:TetR/AcrR family transcriptional regulator [Eggerthella sp. YY7918]|uniref:TetR/AcrR family transcriptional regulator n=1 Tax=Eggerthella sp. (strain YY7918) TaxID=502558 RepID=UPI0002171605|nr:TetR/AcrR family transcriptional regulator [Eggerthella sp. YY7918]BAK44965.1 hypothetical protein EGYY_18300 [Eggerthella sp. YY7918]
METPKRKKPSARELKSKKVRERIYEAAMKLIIDYGYENVTVSDICKSAQITNGTFYHQFSSKLDIVLSCIDREELRLESVLKTLDGQTRLQRIKSIIMARVQIGVEKPLDLAVVCSIANINSRNAGLFNESNKLRIAIENEIAEGQKEGCIDTTIDPSSFAFNLLCYVSGLIHAWELQNGEIDAMSIADQAVDFLLSSISLTPQIGDDTQLPDMQEG